MFAHISTVLLTLPLIFNVADTVPNFNIQRGCKVEARRLPIPMPAWPQQSSGAWTTSSGRKISSDTMVGFLGV